MDYYQLFEQFTRALSVIEDIDTVQLSAAMKEICVYFRISKVTVLFYESVNHEKAGRGEEYVCFDRGRSGETLLSERIVNSIQAVVVCRMYLEEGAASWSQDETERIKLGQTVLLSFFNRCKMQDMVERLRYYDSDDYPNLRYFMRELDRLKGEGSLGGKVAVHFNLRHFTLVNQQVGRIAGNVVMSRYIAGIAELLGDRGVVCRIGGDNFCLICEQDMLEPVLKHLLGTPVVYNAVSNEKIMVSATAGVFQIPQDFVYENFSDIMDKIISASQQARTGGGDFVVFYDHDLIMNREKMVKVQGMFGEALEKEEFKVFYQPKVSVYTGELLGAEALCRWFHDGKIVPPMEFIPILEQNLDICRLDFYMLDHVCRDVRQWLDEGKEVVRVSVNLSRKHMMDFELKEHILEIIDRNNVPHEYIEIELTETTTDVEFVDLKRVVHGLQEAGLSISIDDFGMGYSSLNLLKEVPWNVLKVDKSFLPVAEDDEKSSRSIMFRYVVAMAKELGLECIAEGVETRQQVDILRENRCDLAQGYYFDKPLPKQDYENRMEAHRYQINE
ncbi:MAG: EAL domain-containing protein [Lachnospiraceae bacterium]|nr:EAL domain-containing protein [Lachnospiraceae bacterium]